MALGAGVAVLMVSVSTAGDVPLFERYPDVSFERWQSRELDIDLIDGFQLEGEETDVFKIWEVDLPDFLADLLRVLVVAGVLGALLSMWKRRPRLRWRVRGNEDFDTITDLAVLIEADAAEQRRALSSGAPRNAIVACWLRLEAIVAEAGFERDPADTSEEFTSRVLGQFAVDQTAVVRLAALYREARFSTRDIEETKRVEALESLDAVHDGLRSGVPA